MDFEKNMKPRDIVMNDALRWTKLLVKIYAPKARNLWNKRWINTTLSVRKRDTFIFHVPSMVVSNGQATHIVLSLSSISIFVCFVSYVWHIAYTKCLMHVCWLRSQVWNKANDRNDISTNIVKLLNSAIHDIMK